MTTLSRSPAARRSSEMAFYLAITRDIAVIIFVIAWCIDNI